jgi:hypothetical protein
LLQQQLELWRRWMQQLIPDPQQPSRPWIGVSYRAPWKADVLAGPAGLDCLEVITEHYVEVLAPRRRELEELAARFPLIPHGLGLSLGTDAPLDRARVEAAAELVERVRPPFYTEHLAFTGVPGWEIGHLAPLPCTRQAAEVVSRNARELQEAVGVPLLLENITYDVRLPGEWSEAEFLEEVLARSGCGLLLDLHNLHTNAANHGFDAGAFLEAIPQERVREVHLGGGLHEADGYRVDSHSAPVPPEVWELLRWVAAHCPLRAVILEWDAELPDFSVVLDELRTARAVCGEAHVTAAAAVVPKPALHG